MVIVMAAGIRGLRGESSEDLEDDKQPRQLLRPRLSLRGLPHSLLSSKPGQCHHGRGAKKMAGNDP